MLMSGQRTYPPVVTQPENAPFWEAARNGQLLLKHCRACGKVHYYPRPLCPLCLSDQTEWLPASGEGSIHTFSVMRRVKEPYAIAYVDLAEGVTMLTNIVDCDLDALRIGQPVRLCWRTAEDGTPIPVFAPA